MNSMDVFNGRVKAKCSECNAENVQNSLHEKRLIGNAGKCLAATRLWVS